MLEHKEFSETIDALQLLLKDSEEKYIFTSFDDFLIEAKTKKKLIFDPIVKKSDYLAQIKSKKIDFSNASTPKLVIETKQEEKPPQILEKKENFKIEKKPFINDIEENMDDILKVFKKIDSEFEAVEPLNDKDAKKISKKYELKNLVSEIVILAYKENELEYKFLQKVALALEVYFYKTKVVSAYTIEKDNKWEDFLIKEKIKLVISSDYTIFELKNLKKYFLEKPSLNEKYINNIPLLLLPSINLYLKEPSLKSFLFKTLKQKIDSLNE